MDIHAIAHLGRFKDIVFILFKYGYGDILSRLDLPSRLRPSKPPDVPKMGTWERLRHMLEDLGPTFVKFGQILSLRSDLIPAPLARELSRLQNEVAPESFAPIRKQLEAEWECPLEEIFLDFETDPLAAASLAQVHKAVLRETGEAIAVKVRRPNIEGVVQRDLYILDVLARQLHDHVDFLQFYDLPGLVRELKRSLLRELDFRREARHIRIAGANLARNTYVHIPEVRENLTTSKVLVMDLVQGHLLSEVHSLPEKERHLLARQGIQVTLQQVLQDGFFHADPHPGNIIVQREGHFTLLDWGMVGRLTPLTRQRLLDMVRAVLSKDSASVLEILLLFARESQLEHQDALEREILDILDIYHSLPLGEIQIGQILMELTSLLRLHRIQITTDLAMMVKAMVTAEGSARLICPDLNIINEARPLVERLFRKRYSPMAVLRQMQRSLRDFGSLYKTLPRQAQNILAKMEQGNFTIRFRHENLSGLQRTLETATNRLTLGLLTAAMIIGSSMIVTTGVEPLLFGYPALGIIGFVLSALFALWLIIDIIRRR
ncbi:MAG: ABC1 kinase family protein [Thermodesulfobacteriota bacterium]